MIEPVRLVALISGGIDSPVAAYVMAARGAEVILLHMDNRPFGDDRGIQKAKDLAIILRNITGQEMPLLIADHGENQGIVKQKCDNSYQCVLCKMMMLKVAQLVAKETGCRGIIMGDSLGQVASQTLKNISMVGQSLSIPVIRPLIGFDKLDIEAIAKRIGSYETSIRPELSCTAVPFKPITQADFYKLAQQESKIDMQSMVEKSATSALSNAL